MYALLSAVQRIPQTGDGVLFSVRVVGSGRVRTYGSSGIKFLVAYGWFRCLWDRNPWSRPQSLHPGQTQLKIPRLAVSHVNGLAPKFTETVATLGVSRPSGIQLNSPTSSLLARVRASHASAPWQQEKLQSSSVWCSVQPEALNVFRFGLILCIKSLKIARPRQKYSGYLTRFGLIAI
jgi:hypothetical protein